MGEAGTFSVRELKSRDLPLLRAALPDWTPAEPPGVGLSTHRWLTLIQRIDGKEVPVGLAEYQQVVDEGHLLGIAIMPASRGRNLGSQLLQAVLDEMRGSGCTRCLLEVRRSNIAAQALYERAHFTLDGVRKDYYPPQDAGRQEDALLYSRAL
ncbi:MAG TPA: GNAT family N-acetyltransferase [Pseudomonadales bacterium]